MTTLRITRREAMTVLGIRDERLFRKVVDANPDLVHRLPGETRGRYRTDVIARLLRLGGLPGEGNPNA